MKVLVAFSTMESMLNFTVRFALATICLATIGCQSQTTDPGSLAIAEQARATEENWQRTREQQALLFGMSDDELFGVGITALDDGSWSIAWSTDSPADVVAITGALARIDVSAGSSFGHGHGGWYVDKRDFFAAQSALKQSKDVRRLGITIVEPRVRLSSNGKSNDPSTSPKPPSSELTNQ